jgi:DNA-binding Lrp family transcriptional regulator
MVLDNTDLEILRMLQKNSRSSNSEIASAIGVSIPTVKSRIEGLEKNGVIKRFSVVINRNAFQKNMIVYLLFEASPERINELTSQDSILELNVVSGRTILAKALFPTIQTFTQFLENLDVQNLRIMPVLDTKKEEHEAEVGPEMGVKMECAYCGTEIKNEWYKMKKQNRTLYFCCPVCLRNYKKNVKEEEKPASVAP